MKYVVLLGEGISDGAVAALGGKTPLEVAQTPNLDHLASRGLLGLTRSAPREAAPNVAAGVLAVLGYDPTHVPSASGPLDAAGLGVALGPDDVAMRVDLVTTEANEQGVEVLREPGAASLPDADADALAGDLAASLAQEGVELQPSGRGRLLLVWRRGGAGVRTTPPCFAVGKPVAERQPTGPEAEVLRAMIARSRQVLASHPVCTARRAAGTSAPTTFWPWGEGKAFVLPTLAAWRGLASVAIAGDAMVRGAARLAGLRVLEVADPSPAAHVADGLAALASADALLLHDGAAATASLAGDASGKVAAIERFDAEVVGPVLAGLRQQSDPWRLLVISPQEISCTSRAPTAEPVPFTVYVSGDDARTTGASRTFHERDARDNGIFLPEAHGLLERLLRR